MAKGYEHLSQEELYQIVTGIAHTPAISHEEFVYNHVMNATFGYLAALVAGNPSYDVAMDTVLEHCLDLGIAGPVAADLMEAVDYRISYFIIIVISSSDKVEPNMFNSLLNDLKTNAGRSRVKQFFDNENIFEDMLSEFRDIARAEELGRFHPFCQDRVSKSVSDLLCGDLNMLHSFKVVDFAGWRPSEVIPNIKKLIEKTHNAPTRVFDVVTYLAGTLLEAEIVTLYQTCMKYMYKQSVLYSLHVPQALISHHNDLEKVMTDLHITPFMAVHLYKAYGSDPRKFISSLGLAYSEYVQFHNQEIVQTPYLLTTYQRIQELIVTDGIIPQSMAADADVNFAQVLDTFYNSRVVYTPGQYNLN